MALIFLKDQATLVINSTCSLQETECHEAQSFMSLLLGTNGLGKIAIQGHFPVLDELAVTQFNSSDSKSRKLFTYMLPGPVLSINLPCQLNYAISPQRI